MSAQTLWHPYAQMKNLRVPYDVASAHGATLTLTDGRELIDSVASWWCMIHGYSHPALNRAAKEQLDRMAHVMLGGLTHAPARQLADTLVALTPDGLNHVFFSDSGSVGVEVALKMAVQYWRNTGHPEKTKFAALKKSYHGDTWMAMSVCDPDDGMHALFAGILAQQYFADAPRGGYDASKDIIEDDLAGLRTLFEMHHAELAAFIVEPLLQAAGGFNIYSPDYLRRARALCDEFDILFIFDEVATGFGRTGTLFAAEQARVTPDIMVLGKGLTAGYIGHAATLATTPIFEAFYGEDDANAFMHGPTFMGNPLACAIALESIRLFQDEDYLAKIAHIEMLLKDHLLPLSGESVIDTRVLGATGIVELRTSADCVGLQAFAADRGVWLRPYLNYVYTMPPYVISDDELLQVIDTMRAWVTG